MSDVDEWSLLLILLWFLVKSKINLVGVQGFLKKRVVQAFWTSLWAFLHKLQDESIKIVNFLNGRSPKLFQNSQETAGTRAAKLFAPLFYGRPLIKQKIKIQIIPLFPFLFSQSLNLWVIISKKAKLKAVIIININTKCQWLKSILNRNNNYQTLNENYSPCTRKRQQTREK